MPVMGARALCFPSTDVGFARVVQRMLDDRPMTGPGELERRLRGIVPSAIVRARELSGEREQTFYVYRDGRWSSDADPEWWAHAGTPEAKVSVTTGAVLEANEPLARLLDTDPDWIVGRRYFEFVVPAARTAADVLFHTAIETGTVHSIARVVGPDGREQVCEFRGQLAGDEIVVHVRVVAVASAQMGSG